MDDDDEEKISEEEMQLIEEAETLKEEIDAHRQVVQDTDFYTMTEKVEDLMGSVKLKLRRHLKGHLAKVTGIAWSGDEEYQLLTAAQDSKMILWDTITKNKIYMIPLESVWVMGCALAKSGRVAASGGLDDMICVFNLDTNEGPKLNRKMTGHDGYISGLRFLDDNALLTSSGDKTCALWDIERSKIVSSFPGHINDVTGVALAEPAQHYFASVSADRTCRLWDIRQSTCAQIFEGHDLDINGVTFFPQSEYAFVTSSDDSSCRLWDIRADQPIALYADEYIQCASTCVAVSKSGRLLIAGYDDYNCHVWDVLREERVSIMPAHDGRVSGVSLSKDGGVIATGSWDSTVILWTSK